MKNLISQYNALYDELNDVYSMSEEAARFRYNADSKDEVVANLEWEINSLNDQMEQKNRPVYSIVDAPSVDEAFSDITEFYRMRA